jgi:hypothetical protein
VKTYLPQWLRGKRSLKKDTWDSYEEAIRLYFIPAFGHIKLWQLRKAHIDDLVTPWARSTGRCQAAMSRRNCCAG